MTTLYEHKILGSKISMVNANFNIPFLNGYGSIYLYELGIIIVDENGNEKYIIELDRFNVKYEKMINIRNFKYVPKATVFTKDFGKKYKNFKRKFKIIKGNYYGKFIIVIHEFGDIILLDNRSMKYKDFYEKINFLKLGVNPLKNLNNNKKDLIIKFLKSKFFKI